MSDVDRVGEVDRIVASACNAHTADREGFTGWSRENLIALAQVHATVALAEAQEQAARAGAERLLEGLSFYEGDLTVRIWGEVKTK